jgi:hypothetical protein
MLQYEGQASHDFDHKDLVKRLPLPGIAGVLEVQKQHTTLR